MVRTNRTIEDRIADQDKDWVRARNSAVAWAHDRIDDGGPQDIHARREASVHEGEANDPRNYKGAGE
jgi:hypothetical protein